MMNKLKVPPFVAAERMKQGCTQTLTQRLIISGAVRCSQIVSIVVVARCSLLICLLNLGCCVTSSIP